MRQYIALGNKLAKMGRRSASAVKTRVSVKTPSYTLAALWYNSEVNY